MEEEEEDEEVGRRFVRAVITGACWGGGGGPCQVSRWARPAVATSPSREQSAELRGATRR